jgi:hypothetical protein
MRIVATPRTAALTGLWTVLGGMLLERWEQTHPRTTIAYKYAAAFVGIFFFLIPVLLFVIGTSYLQLVRKSPTTFRPSPFRTLWANRRSFWQDVFGPLYFRMLCWFLAGGVATLIYSAVQHFRR